MPENGICYIITDFSPTFSYVGLKPISGLILAPGINAGVSKNLKITQPFKPWSNQKK